MCIKLPIIARESERGESNFPPKSKSLDDAVSRGQKNGPYKRSLKYNSDGNRNKTALWRPSRQGKGEISPFVLPRFPELPREIARNYWP